MHHDTCVTHVPWCMPGSLTSVFRWGRWRGKRSRHSRRMCNPQFYLSGKRPLKNLLHNGIGSLRLNRDWINQRFFISWRPSVRRQSYYLNQRFNIVNWTLRNKIQWNLNRNYMTFIQENAFESVVLKIAADLSQPQCVALFMTDSHPIYKYIYWIGNFPGESYLGFGACHDGLWDQL